MHFKGPAAWHTSLLLVFAAASTSSVAHAIDDVTHDALLRGDDVVVMLNLSVAAVNDGPMNDGAARAEPVSENGPRFAAIQDRILGQMPDGEFRLRYKYSYSPTIAVRINSLDTLEAIEAIEGVASVYADGKGAGEMLESRELIGANAANNLGLQGLGATVAILDSGIDTDNYDFNPDPGNPDPEVPGYATSSIIYEKSFLNAGDVGDSADDDNGHGTNVSGIIASRGKNSQPGLAPEANIVAIKVLDSNNEGWISDWTAAVEHVIDLHVQSNGIHIDVLNMSFASSLMYQGVCADAFPAFEAACAKAFELGIMLVASAGNSGSRTSWPLPACYASVYSVASTADDADTLSAFTNRNELIDFVAPGEGITSSGTNNTASRYSGTSQACPHVAGLACLILQIERDITPDQLRTLLRTTGAPIFDLESPVTYKRIDAYEAVNASLLLDEDCNGNRESDTLDIIRGVSRDCNGNGTPDWCDINVTGESSDCNLNTIPDECDVEQAFHFVARGATQVGGGSIDILAMDLDRDGTGEIAVLLESGNIALLNSVEEGMFQVYQNLFLDVDPVGFEIADLNGDRFPDIVVANSTNPSVSVFLGLGNGRFGAEWRQSLAAEPSSLTVARLDGDGSFDVALTTAAGIELLLGNGDGTFSAAPQIALDELPVDVEFADLNGDDKSDLVVALDSPYLQILEGDGNGGFAQGARIDVGRGARFVETADFDHDGDIDLLAATAEGRDVILISNRGSSGFGVSAILRSGNRPSSALFADLDLDRNLDLVVTSQDSDTISIFRGDGRGFFLTEQALTVNTSPSGVAALDWDGDGNSELLVSGIASGSIIQIANDSKPEDGADCNRNGIPDECELDVDSDRNSDSILDVCQTELKFFNRGDPNTDGSADLSDGIFIFEYLFLGGVRSDCTESADANHDGVLDISDGLYLLKFLFMGGEPPTLPGPPGQLCGVDNDPPGSPADLGCDEYEPCR